MRRFLVLLALLFAVMSSPANAQSKGHIYLIKGFAGIFSTGLDTLGDELVRRGYKATVHSHTEYSSLAVEAAALQKAGKGPIVIIGHSLGADVTIPMAELMAKENARVALLVAFAPDYTMTAPANIAQLMNYYQGDAIITKGPGFRGTISNINLDGKFNVNHFNMEKVDRFHAEVIAKIQSIMGRSR